MNATRALARPPLALVPEWRGDESLYSWSAAFHLINGGSSAKDTAETLFGIPHAPRLIDVPASLDHFCDRTGGLLGPPVRILEHRTLFGYLSRFVPAVQRQRAAEAAQGHGSVSAATWLGLKFRGVARMTHLKACPECALESVECFGLPTWRLVHQLPLALICLKHGLPLQIYRGRDSVWSLPGSHSPGRPVTLSGAPSRRAATSLALVEAAFLQSPGQTDPDMFRRATLKALERIGLVKAHLRLDGEEVARWLDGSDAWRVVTANHAELATRGVGTVIQGLLRRRVTAHPTAWSLLWAAIADASPDALGWLMSSLQDRTLIHEQLSLRLETSAPQSDTPANFAEVLMRNGTLAEVAKELRVCRATIQRWLGREVGLRKQWNRIRLAERRAHAVANIRAYLHATPHTNRADMLRQCKTDVAWLQRHDTMALQELLLMVPSDRAPQGQLWPQLEVNAPWPAATTSHQYAPAEANASDHRNLSEAQK